MKTIDIECQISINKLIELLNCYYKDKISIKDKKQFDDLVLKLHSNIVEKFISLYNLVIGVHRKYNETEELRTTHMEAVQQEKVSYIFLKCLEQHYIDKDKSINIRLKSYDKTFFELNEYLNAISILVGYTPTEKSKSLSISDIDNIINIDPKKIALGVKNSLTNRLIKRKDDNYFRPNPKTNDEIVQIDDLGKYLHLNDKYINIECPVCGTELKINNNSLAKIIVLDKSKNYIQILCHHARTPYETKMPYKIDKNKYLIDGKYTAENIAMFVINNYKKLTGKYEILDSKNINNRETYQDIGDKHIFIRVSESKIRIDKESINKVFEIENKKIYINQRANLESGYKRIGYLELDGDIMKILENKSDFYIKMFVVSNFNILVKKHYHDF